MPSTSHPYAAQHAVLNGPGDQRPTAEQIVRDESLVNGIQGCNALITGCTSGIGVETAKSLYLAGANVYITARDMVKGNAVAAELSEDPSRPVKVLELFLDSFESIKRCAERFLSQESKLSILVLNGAVMACPQSVTVDGHELQFGTNHLGHFYLFQLLKTSLLDAATPDRPSRVVAVSSSAHRMVEDLPFDDLDFSKSNYDPWIAYGRSKLANIWFANELDRRFGSQGIHATSLHPGSITSGLQRHVQANERYKAAMEDPQHLRSQKSAGQGAATTVWAAVGKEWTHRGGVYLDNVAQAELADPTKPLYTPGYAKATYYPEGERKLWEVSTELCGLGSN